MCTAPHRSSVLSCATPLSPSRYNLPSANWLYLISLAALSRPKRKEPRRILSACIIQCRHESRPYNTRTPTFPPVLRTICAAPPTPPLWFPRQLPQAPAPPSRLWQLVVEPRAVSVGLATPIKGSALFQAGIFGCTKNLVVLSLGLPNQNNRFVPRVRPPPPPSFKRCIAAFFLASSSCANPQLHADRSSRAIDRPFSTPPLTLLPFFLASIDVIGAVGMVHAGLHWELLPLQQQP